MTEENLKRGGRMLLLLAVQILVLNHIHIAGYITPLIIGYMLICFRQGSSRVGLLLWGFLTGFLFDVFSNTAGMASAACTLLAMMQPGLLDLFTPRDSSEGFIPTMRGMGLGKYFLYALLSMMVLHTAFYALDAFTLHNVWLTLLSIAGSTLVAAVLAVCLDMLLRKRS